MVPIASKAIFSKFSMFLLALEVQRPIILIQICEILHFNVLGMGQAYHPHILAHCGCRFLPRATKFCIGIEKGCTPIAVKYEVDWASIN